MARAKKPQEEYLGKPWSMPRPKTLYDRIEERKARRAQRDAIQADEAGDQGVPPPVPPR